MSAAVVVFPQWQGAGAKGRPIGPGCVTLAEAFDLPVDSVVPVDQEAFDPSRNDGVVSRLEVTSQLRMALMTLSRLGDRPTLTIGGDCSIDLAPIAIAHRRFGDALHVVYFDAHGDANNPTVSPSGALHGMVVRHALGDGDAAVIGLMAAALTPSQITFRGVRELDQSEVDFIASVGLRQGSIGDEPPPGMLHLHVDLDVLDPAIFPHTTYPTPGGPSPQELADDVTACVATGRVVSISITENVATTADQLAPIAPVITAIKAWVATEH
jgi:arginase